MASKVKTAGGLDFVTDAANARNERATLRAYATNRCNESALLSMPSKVSCHGDVSFSQENSERAGC